MFSLMHAGAPLWKSLAAGEWKSQAFFTYLDLHRLDNESGVQAQIENEFVELDG